MVWNDPRHRKSLQSSEKAGEKSGAFRERADDHVFDGAVRAVAGRAESVERGHAERRGKISVRSASHRCFVKRLAELDIRFTHLADAPKIERQLRALGPILPGARVDVRGGINRPPLERTPAVAALFHHAQKLMRELGQTLDETSVGGGSDGNFTAALGVPTLDGLGATGNGAHSAVEHVIVHSLPERAALLAGLLATL